MCNSGFEANWLQQEASPSSRVSKDDIWAHDQVLVSHKNLMCYILHDVGDRGALGAGNPYNLFTYSPEVLHIALPRASLYQACQAHVGMKQKICTRIHLRACQFQYFPGEHAPNHPSYSWVLHEAQCKSPLISSYAYVLYHLAVMYTYLSESMLPCVTYI